MSFPCFFVCFVFCFFVCFSFIVDLQFTETWTSNTFCFPVPSCTVNSRLADPSLLRTPCYYEQQLNPRRKLQTFDWNKLPILRTLAITDLRTLYSVQTSQFYCCLSCYSGHRAASWNICTHIKSIFSAFWGCLCRFWSIAASSVHYSKFLHLFLLRSSLQSCCHE